MTELIPLRVWKVPLKGKISFINFFGVSNTVFYLKKKSNLIYLNTSLHLGQVSVLSIAFAALNDSSLSWNCEAKSKPQFLHLIIIFVIIVSYPQRETERKKEVDGWMILLTLLFAEAYTVIVVLPLILIVTRNFIAVDVH